VSTARFVGLEADIRSLKSDILTTKADVSVLKWMVGFVLAFQFGIFVKTFLH
jgi:hypothetical protein